MSEPILDYDPLQEQIRAALSSAADVARDLEAMEPHVPETCRALIGSLVKELHKGKVLRERLPRLLQMQAYLNAVHHICAAEALALELRADRRC